MLSVDPNLPNGGLFARFPGLYIPILDFSFNGPAPTDTQFDTVVITRQYDFFADFPLYPLNVIAVLNAFLGFFYVHLTPSTSACRSVDAFPDTHGNTDYYFFETQDLPLFGPLRTLGVPEALIDVFEPFFRVIVELGYDRSIPPWVPTPARLIPPFNPATLAAIWSTRSARGSTTRRPPSARRRRLVFRRQPTADRDVSATETTLSRVSHDGVTASQSTFVAGRPSATPTSTPAPASSSRRCR